MSQLQLELRWEQRNNRWVNPSNLFDKTKFDVAPIPGDSEAKAFVVAHHYAASMPAARWRFGMYEQGELVGVAVFSHPASDKVLTNVFPGKATDSVELGRLVLLDRVGFNGESWFVRRCLDQLKAEGIRGVVSFSDPVRRERADGTVVMPGHIGQVYQALSARFMGRGTPRTLRLLPDGTVFSDRAAQKIRALERGWRYSAAILEAAGAAPLVDGADPREWLALWLPKLTRKLRHPGNLRYGWALQRKVWAVMPPAQDYPKKPQTTPKPTEAA